MPQTSLKFDERHTRLVAVLKEHYSAGSKTEVIRKALQLLDTVRRAQKNGEQLALVNKDGKVQGFVVL
jgi:hypothetical protein